MCSYTLFSYKITIMTISPVMKNVFLKTKYNPDIRWIDFEGKECFYFYFNGIFKEKDAILALERGTDLILSKPKRKNTLICNFLDVSDYETEARSLLQNVVNKNRDYIGDVYVITESPIIFAAVEIISFFTSKNIKVVCSVEKLQDKLNVAN